MQTKKSLFTELFGESPTIKILDFLLTERELDFSISDMARNAGIGRASLYRIFDDLIRNQIILPTRIIGKSKLYKLNVENPKIKKLVQIDDMLILEELRSKAENQKHKIKVAI
ncbi:MAG: hypothetical protein AABX32_08385 [Nanoarchaeota archaeon]